MPEQTHVLRMSVNQNHQATRAATHATQGNPAGSPVGDTEAHYAARGGEQTGDLLRQDGEERRLMRLFDLHTVHDGNRHGQMADIRLVAGAGNDHFVQRIVPGNVRAVCLRLSRERDEGGGQEAEGYIFFRHIFVFNI